MPSLSSGGAAHAVKMRPGGPDGRGQAKLGTPEGTEARGDAGVDGRERSAWTREGMAPYAFGRAALAAASAAAASFRSRLSRWIALIFRRLSR
jgi:hypothetical protein